MPEDLTIEQPSTGLKERLAAALYLLTSYLEDKNPKIMNLPLENGSVASLSIHCPITERDYRSLHCWLAAMRPGLVAPKNELDQKIAHFIEGEEALKEVKP